MSKPERPSQDETVSAEALSRPRHGHQPSDVGHVVDIVDPHPAWLKKWRSLRTGLSGGRSPEGSVQSLRELQTKIARTPAETLAGLRAQAELISELAWNDVVAATARQLIAGIKRLQQSSFT
jgi:hypothetical protein